MLDLLPLIIILLCLAAIIFVVVRKFPQLANLDLQHLSEEKEHLKKKEILDKRITEKGRQLKAVWKQRLMPVRKIWGQVQLRFRIYFGKIEHLWHHEQSIKLKKKVKEMSREEKQDKIAAILKEANNHLLLNNTDKAEELYISAIKIDVKCQPAYRGLADTYLAKNSLDEARQTYLFLLQLDPEDDYVLVKLAEIAESQGDLEEAIGYYQQAAVTNDAMSPRFYHLAELLLKVKQPETAREAIIQAVELEPKNPKYLDLLVETAIICGDKMLAQKGYEEFRIVNPDNHKLADLRERIQRI
ncbi:MAG: tetratricopeptide repeat protein [bacterium]|nr:tetratricopeptide repeat protein [bacterium]